MFKYIIIILLMPFMLHSIELTPEWEKVKLNMDSLPWYGQILNDVDNNIYALLPNGIYKTSEDNDFWTRLNIPDSLIFDNTYFSLNGPTIYTYGYVHNPNKSLNWYFVYSNNYGNSWHIIPTNELIFPGYDLSIFSFIDNEGEIWGISSNKKREPESKLVVNKFDILNKTTTKLYELPKSFHKILLKKDLVVLLEFNSVPDLNDISQVMKEMQVHYSKDGLKWDSLFFNKYNTENFDKIEGQFSGFSFIFDAKGSIYTYIGSQSAYTGCLLKIDMETKLLEVLDNKFSNTAYLTKLNDSTFYKSDKYLSSHWRNSIFKSKDMVNWEIFASPYKLEDIDDSVEYCYCDFYTNYWNIDNNKNHYFFNNYGLIKISDEEKICTQIVEDGLEYVDIDDISIDSKSNIVLVNNSYISNLIIINPDEDTKNIINHNFGIDSKGLFKSLSDDVFIFDKYDIPTKTYGTFSFNKDFSSQTQLKVNDSTHIRLIKNPKSMGNKFLAYAEYKLNDSLIYNFAYTEDNCQTWNILENIPVPKEVFTYGHFINTNLDIFHIKDKGFIQVTSDFGKSWKTIFNDSLNPQFNKNTNSYKIDKFIFNEANGAGIIKYQSGGPIYYTLDQGYTWKLLDTNLQAFKFINTYTSSSKSDYAWVDLPFSFDESYNFYINTPLGLFSSTDTLKSFKNISKNLIEPSYIYEFKAGNDGKLYAVNSRGVWRTKEKLVNSLNSKIETYFTDNINLNVIPNPATDQIEIPVLNSNNIEKVQVFDLSLNKVMETEVTNGNNKISISHLPTGVYFVKISGQMIKFIAIQKPSFFYYKFLYLKNLFIKKILDFCDFNK